MYELLSAIILSIICYVIYRQPKDIETIVQSNTEFYTAYAEYVKAISEHNKIVHECLGKLDSSYEKSYYAITALAAHTEYLEGIVHSLEEKYYKIVKEIVMRYKGRCNPLAVLISCLTLGFLPTILLILGIIWIVNLIPVWLWTVLAVTGFMMFIVKTFKEEKANEKQE